MPSINYTDASTTDELRNEFVKDLLDRSKRAEAEAKDAKSAGDKAKAQRVANEFRLMAEYWQTIHLGNPLRASPGSKPS